jgi:16S rRNA processing protein RimM
MATAPPEPAGADAAVILGKVGAPHGVQGWVKVLSYTEPAEGIAGYADWTLVRDGTAVQKARVLEWKRAGRAIAVRLEGVETREGAQALTGTEVSVPRAALPVPASREFYLHDLLGLDAVNREGISLGQVDGFLELPAHPVVVLREGRRERLVPLVRERLVDVDLTARRITFDWHPDD